MFIILYLTVKLRKNTEPSKGMHYRLVGLQQVGLGTQVLDQLVDKVTLHVGNRLGHGS